MQTPATPIARDLYEQGDAAHPIAALFAAAPTPREALNRALVTATRVSKGDRAAVMTAVLCLWKTLVQAVADAEAQATQDASDGMDAVLEAMDAIDEAREDADADTCD